ncbi:MAG: hypothetical protein DRJ37_07205 [Thermoprotei archaeon]|nr:MAG: hypothetical protein DRJ37_07205 [Thermoprotei archaeon]
MSKISAGELNVIRKKGRPGDLKVALFYPSLYHVALDTLSFHMLYFYVNNRRGFIAERFNIVKKFGQEPRPYSLENKTPLKNFDVILVSVHYEPDYVNIVRFLQAGGISVFSSEREKPYIIVGGPAVISNPEPLAEIVDVFAMGDIEPILPYLLDRLLEFHDRKHQLLEALPPEKGFYVPQRGDKEVIVNKAIELPLEFHPIAQIQPAGKSPRGRKTMIEVMRGCFRECSFCLEGAIFKPKRERSYEQVRVIAETGSYLNKSRKIVLLALSYFDHSESDKILEYLVNNDFEVSVPSIRVETLNEKRLELIVAGGQKTLTIAPETADYSLSLEIGKPLLQAKIENVAFYSRKMGIKSLKLYFMIGLPGETIEHIKKIVDFVKKISEKSGYRGVRELKITVSPFVPKPHTPMQLARIEDIQTLKKKINLLKRELGGFAEIRSHDPRWSHIQAILSRGNRLLSKLLILWAKYGGGLGGWRKAIKDLNLDIRKYLTPTPDFTMPWKKIRLS